MAIFRSPAKEKDEINNGLAAGATFSFSPHARSPFSLPLSSACHAENNGPFFFLMVHFPLLRCEDPTLHYDPEDMITVAHLYCVSLAFRLAIGGLSVAISSGLMLCLVSRFCMSAGMGLGRALSIGTTMILP